MVHKSCAPICAPKPSKNQRKIDVLGHALSRPPSAAALPGRLAGHSGRAFWQGVWQGILAGHSAKAGGNLSVHFRRPIFTKTGSGKFSPHPAVRETGVQVAKRGSWRHVGHDRCCSSGPVRSEDKRSLRWPSAAAPLAGDLPEQTLCATFVARSYISFWGIAFFSLLCS